MGASKKSTIGYKYYMGIHAVLCRGAGKIKAIYFADRLAWSGEVTENTTITVNEPELFGGEKKEGGVAGQIDIMMGGPTQTKNQYLQEKIQTVVPAFRGVVSLVLKSFYFSAMTPYAKKISVEMERIPQADWLPGLANINGDANPAHIILEMLTHPEWGMGYLQANCNMVQFAEVAQTLYDEGFGLSFKISSEDEYEKLIEMVMTHINGLFYTQPSTGLYTIKLLRADYLDTLGDLPVYDPTNCELESFERPNYAEIVNEITVKYRPQGKSKDDTVTVTNLAAIQNQGAKINQTINYPAIGNAELAAKVASRDLRQKSTPLAKFRIRVNRKAWNLEAGDVFKLSWPSLGISQIIGRALQIDYGTIEEGAVTIEAIEDIFGLPAADYLVNQPAIWTDPAQTPTPLVDYKGYEAPFWEVVQNLGEEAAIELYNTAPGAAFLTSVASNPPYLSIEYELWTPTGKSNSTTNSPIVYPATELETVAELGATGTELDILTDRSSLFWLDAGSTIYIQNKTTGVYETLEVVSITETTQSGGGMSYPKLEIVVAARTGAVFPAGSRVLAPAPAGTSRAIMGLNGPTYSGYCLDENDTTLSSFSPAYDSATDTFTGFENGATYLVGEELVTCTTASPLVLVRGAQGTVPTKHLSGAYFFRISVTVPVVSEYEEAAASSYSPVAYSTRTVGKTDKSIKGLILKGNFTGVRVGSYCIWDDEICVVEYVSKGLVILGRGALDTIPQEHAANTKIFFGEDTQATSDYEYLEGEELDFKFRPRGATKLLPLDDAPVNTITMVGRIHRPYPPGRIGFNSQLYPAYFIGEADLTWAHRDALTQTAQVIDHTGADVGPQTGTTYEVDVYDEDEVLVKTLTGITANHYEIVENEEHSWAPKYETVPRNEVAPYSPDPQAATVNSYCHFEDYGYGNDWTHDEFQPRAIVDSVTSGHFTLGWTFWNGATLTTADKKFGTKSLYLDGVSAYARSIVGWQTAALNFGLDTDAFTIEFWAKLKNLDTTIHVGDLYADKINPLLGFGGSGKWLRVHPITMQLVLSDFTPSIVYATDIVPQNVWVHFALVRRAGGTQLDIYMNGKRQRRYTVTPSNMGLELYLGVATLTEPKHTEMYVDEFRWTNNFERYDADFTPLETEHDELADTHFDNTVLYVPFLGRENSTLFPDFTGRHSLVATGGVAITAYRTSLNLNQTNVQYVVFDGSSGFIEVQNNTGDFHFGTGDFTIEFDILHTGSPLQVLLDCLTGSDGWQVAKAADDKIEFKNSAGVVAKAANALPAGFCHIAITRISGTVRIFMNGALEDTVTDTTDYSAGAPLFIGASVTSGVGSDFYNGRMSALRITKGVGRYSAAFALTTQYLFYPTKAPVPKLLGNYERLRMNGNLTFSCKSVLFAGTADEREAMQVPEHKSYRNGYGLNYGRYYGVP